MSADKLYKACAEGDLETVKYMYSIQRVDDIKIRNDYASRYASKNGQLEVIKYLITVGADVEYVMKLACMYKHLNIVLPQAGFL